jgi:hypothetical protein
VLHHCDGHEGVLHYHSRQHWCVVLLRQCAVGGALLGIVVRCWAQRARLRHAKGSWTYLFRMIKILSSSSSGASCAGRAGRSTLRALGCVGEVGGADEELGGKEDAMY